MNRAKDIHSRRKKKRKKKKKTTTRAMAENDAGDQFATEAPRAPITKRNIKTDLEEKIPKPYLGRALIAPGPECPEGAPGHEHHGRSVLQQHAGFFDTDDDGKIYPWDTYKGVRKIGFSRATSLFAAVSFNGAFSYITSPSWIPNVLFPIHVPTIHQGKHGSDAGVYDNEGRYIPARLENVFSRFGVSKPDHLNLKEVWRFTEGAAVAGDPFGKLVTKVEWIMLYYLGKDKDGYVSKEAARGVFDGSFFEYCASKNKRD